MRRILVVETASPKRVRLELESILAKEGPATPELRVLCRPDRRTLRYLGEVKGAQLIPLDPDRRRETLAGLRNRPPDQVVVFWTGEKQYGPMKRLALGIRAREVKVNAGDGNVFVLTWKAWIRFFLFRLRHRLPTDHYDFVPPVEAPEPAEYYEGERVLVIQSAEPAKVLRGLETISGKNLFREPRFCVFSRNQPDIVRHFENHALVHELRTHSETRGSARHLRQLRAQHYDAVVVFFTGDPSYWKIKYFAFLLGARHKLIFNENNDCFFFSLGRWLALLSHRLGERTRSAPQPRWSLQLGLMLFLIAKVALFPLRFAWLLLVWLRLRIAG